jgi:hypothetical protein
MLLGFVQTVYSSGKLFVIQKEDQPSQGSAIVPTIRRVPWGESA